MAAQGGTGKAAKPGVDEEDLRPFPTEKPTKVTCSGAEGDGDVGATCLQSVSFLGFPDWGSFHSLSVVETNYDEYALLFSRGTKGPGQDFRMATLYSRYPSPQAHPQGRCLRLETNQDLTLEGSNKRVWGQGRAFCLLTPDPSLSTRQDPESEGQPEGEIHRL